MPLIMSGCQPHQERGPDVPLEVLPDEGRGALAAHGDQRHVVQGAREEPPVATGKCFQADYSNSRQKFATKTDQQSLLMV